MMLDRGLKGDNGQEDIRNISEMIRNRGARVIGSDGEAKSLPASVYSFLLLLLADINDGKPVSILQDTAELTTVQASQWLGVSRQFLITRLLPSEIHFQMVGTHRRIYAKDVLEYKVRRDSERKRALDELLMAERTEGLLDRISHA